MFKCREWRTDECKLVDCVWGSWALVTLEVHDGERSFRRSPVRGTGRDRSLHDTDVYRVHHIGMVCVERLLRSLWAWHGQQSSVG